MLHKLFNIYKWVKKDAFKPTYKAFNSINTLPFYNYQQVIETGKLTYLLKDIDYDTPPKANLQQLSQIWEQINNQIIDKFGIPERYRMTLMAEAEIIKLRLRAAVTDDRSLLTIANVKERQLKESLENQHSADLYELKVLIETNFKMQIDIHKMTVRDFYTYLQLIERAQK